MAAKKQAAYTSKDLAGMKVFHSLDAFKEGESVVLTMKDARILDEKGTWRTGSRALVPRRGGRRWLRLPASLCENVLAACHRVSDRWTRGCPFSVLCLQVN